MRLGFRVVLASSSVWRAQLLNEAGVSVDVVPPEVDEDAISASSPVGLALARAIAKAEAVATWQPHALVIGADQVAHIRGEAFGKPTDPADHRARLRSLRGRTHTLSTAVAFRGISSQAWVQHTEVSFRSDVSDAEIDAYVATGDGSGCAGGYRAEGPGAWLIAGITGEWSNVIGLPVFSVLDGLRRVQAGLAGAAAHGMID